MQVWLLTAGGVVLAMAIWATALHLRSRWRPDRHELDDLRRIYRRDNPRGPGLEPLIRDQQRAGLRYLRRDEPGR